MAPRSGAGLSRPGYRGALPAGDVAIGQCGLTPDKVMEGMAVWQKPAAGPGLSGEAGESAKHRLHVLAELKNRGVIDALMAVW